MYLGILLLDLVAIVGGRVHTMVPGASAVDATVLIEDDRVTAVGADLAVPAAARIVDARGLHVVPGLIDGFGYHDPEHDPLYLRSGIAVLRDHGNELGRIFASRERPDRDQRAGPLLSVCGAVIDGSPPSTNAALIARSKAEAHDLVIHLSEEKLDFVAFHANLSAEAHAGLCEAAREKELAVWGPRTATLTLDQALENGQRGFLYLDTLLPADKTWESAQVADFEPVIKKLIERGAMLTPVLRGSTRWLEDQGDAAAELAWLAPQYDSLWRAELLERRPLLNTPTAQRAAAMFGKQRAVLFTAHKLGLRLVPGSGAPHPWLMPGEGLIRELAEWQNLGISAAECLAYATREAARSLGLSERHGTLEAGKFADLLLVRADPTHDVHALSEVEVVIQRGRVFDAAELEQRAAALKTELTARKVAASTSIEVDPPKLPEGVVLLSGRVETMGATGRIAAERFAIVRELDDTLTFCGRRRLLPSAGNSEAIVDVRQRVRKNALDSFEVKVRNSGREFVARGTQVAGQWRVERRLDDVFIDIQAAREALAAVDCDSVTTFLLLGHTREEGHFAIVRMEEGLQLEVVRWDLALDEDGDHSFRTPSGLKFVGYEEYGAIQAVVEQVGAGALQTTLMEVDQHGGPGLPLPAAKLALKRAKPAASGDGK